MKRSIRIKDRCIGKGKRVFIIAEAGVNHNGSLAMAKRLIDAAASSGADAVKFQAFSADDLASRRAEKPEYQKVATDPKESQYEMLKDLQLKAGDFEKLAAYAKKKSIIFLSSPFDKGNVDLLNDLNVPAFKIPSGEITNIPLLKYIAKKRKPIILSTGMSNLNEVKEALEAMNAEGTKEIALLHCVTSYPARVGDINLRTMETISKVFNLPTGFSDHTEGSAIAIAAAALGACILEKHFTLDKALPGPDHKTSLEPDEFKDMVDKIRDVEKALGDGVKRLTPVEKIIKKAVRRSVVARVNIPKNTRITADMLTFKRPGIGIEPKYISTILGRTSKMDIKIDEVVKKEQFR